MLTKVNTARLVKERVREKKAASIARIEKALISAKLQFWELISNLLYEVAAQQVKTIYYGGGSGIFIKDKLREYCREEEIPLIAASELNRINTEVKILPPLTKVLNLKPYELESFIAQNLELRCQDVWDLFVNLTDYYSEYLNRESHRAKAVV